MGEVAVKQCFKCGKLQPLSQFYANLRMSDGHVNKCKLCTIAAVKQNYIAHHDHYVAYDKRRQQTASRRKNKASYLITYRRRHKGFSASHCAKRRAKKKQAMPTWVDARAIKQVYLSCPQGMVVDHIVPLQNPIVCGLHVPWNLQYLTAVQNSRKGSSF